MNSITTILTILAAICGGISNASDMLYGVTLDNRLISINPNTGAGTLIGVLDSIMSPLGLSERNGRLYTFDQFADRIREVNQTNGDTLATIDVGINAVGEGDFTLRSDGIGFLSAADGGGTLWQFDIDIPNSMQITAPGGLSPLMDGLTYDATDVLYGLSQGSLTGGSRLYTINQSSGATSPIGSLGVGTTVGLAGLDFTSDGTLFAVVSGGGSSDPPGSTLYRVDAGTGTAIFVGEIGFNDVSGLAAIPQVPEPSSTYALLLVGGALILVTRHWKARNVA